LKSVFQVKIKLKGGRFLFFTQKELWLISGQFELHRFS
jgi:hypothetical protein